METRRYSTLVAWLLTLTIALGGPESELGLLPLHLAEARGSFATAGVEVTFSKTKGEASAAEALRRGQVSLAATSLQQILQEEWKENPPRLVVLLTQAFPAGLLVAAPHQETIKGLGNLKGKSVGIPAPGSPPALILTWLLRRSGVEAHQVDFQGLGYARTQAAVADGRIYAGITQSADTARLLAKGQAVLLLDFSDPAGLSRLLGGPYLHFGLFAREETIKEKEGEVTRLVQAVVENLRFLADAEPEVILRALPPRVVGVSQTFLDRLTAARQIYSRNGLATSRGVETVSQLLWAVVPRKGRPPKPESLLEMRFILSNIP